MHDEARFPASARRHALPVPKRTAHAPRPHSRRHPPRIDARPRMRCCTPTLTTWTRRWWTPWRTRPCRRSSQSRWPRWRRSAARRPRRRRESLLPPPPVPRTVRHPSTLHMPACCHFAGHQPSSNSGPSACSRPEARLSHASPRAARRLPCRFPAPIPFPSFPCLSLARRRSGTRRPLHCQLKVRFGTRGCLWGPGRGVTRVCGDGDARKGMTEAARACPSTSLRNWNCSSKAWGVRVCVRGGPGVGGWLTEKACRCPGRTVCLGEGMAPWRQQPPDLMHTLLTSSRTRTCPTPP